MYEAFWRLERAPFVVTPDVRFLLRARSHHDSLVALLEGVARETGVMVLVGDVGTGKTLLCRALCAEMSASYRSVLVINPYLSGAELVGAILDDLGAARAGSTHGELMAALARHLVAVGARGQSVVVIVDEAQQMSVEALEQIRILSTIEMPGRKLLQVVLVGQPELSDKLGRRDLYQLDQRIGVRCRLQPLSARDTYRYVEHRLRVAGLLGALPFTRPALVEVYRATRGIPRVINLVSDRALARAFSARADEVTPDHVKAAVRDVAPRTRPPGWGLSRVTAWLEGARRSDRRAPLLRRAAAVGVVGVALLAGAGVLAYRSGMARIPPWPPAITAIATSVASHGPEEARALPPMTPTPAADPPSALPSAPAAEAAPSVDPLASSSDGAGGLGRLVARVLRSWGVAGPPPDPQTGAWPSEGTMLDLAAVAARHGLSATRLGPVDLADLRAIGLPAIVEVQEAGGSRPYLVLAVDRDTATLGAPTGEEARVTLGSLEASWTHAAWIIWRNVDGLPTAPAEPWTEAKLAAAASRLRDLGHLPRAQPSRAARTNLARAVRRFQTAAGLRSDGILGPLTVLALARAAAGPRGPGLVAAH